MKKNIAISILSILGAIILLHFQACELPVASKRSLEAGNGGTYWGGLAVTAPPSAQPGETFEVTATGGQAPYTFSIAAGQARIQSVDENIATVLVDSNAQPGDEVSVQVEDSQGETALAKIKIAGIAPNGSVSKPTLSPDLKKIAYLSNN